jgi:methyl-accepting chemotaxis protein
LTAAAVPGERARIVLFRRRAPAIIITSVIFVIGAMLLISNFLTSRLLEASKEANYKIMRDVLASVLKAADERALSRAEIVEAIPTIHNAFVAKDREKLLAETMAMFKEQDEKYALQTAQFHLAPGISFLRLHKPEKFGDDQTSYRPMLVDVNTSHVVRKGIAITRTGPSIYGIVPVTDAAGNHFGSFEMGLELDTTLNTLKEGYNIEATAFVDEKMLTEIATDLKGDVMSPKNRVGRYIRFHATHPELAASLVTDREVDVKEPKNFERTVAGTLWGVQLVPMYSYSGKQIGVFALATNLADERADANRVKVWMALSALFAIVLIAGISLIVTRGLLLSPVRVLGERMRALADGDASQPADPIDSYVDEVKPLAESYERLRKEKSS